MFTLHFFVRLTINFQPYLAHLMNEIRDFYFLNKTTDFDLIDQFYVLKGDVTLHYYIEQWISKHVAVSRKNTYYHRLVIAYSFSHRKPLDISP